MPKSADTIFQDKINHILGAEKRLGEAVVAHQRKLYELIVSEYLPKFQLKDGLILDSTANTRLLGEVDNLFSKLERSMYKDVVSPFARDLLKSAELSGAYYQGLGFKKTVIDGLLRNKVALEKRIGITPKGKLRKTSYLYKLGQTAQVRDELQNYVLSSLTGDTSFLDFQLGFRNLVVGNRRTKALAVSGRLVKYFDQFAYDTFNQMDAVANRQLATNLNLHHFIYEGSLIDTSRVFCEKRAGKAFTVKETLKWKDDPDLVDKKTKDTYRPLIDRGRYRCRHYIKYITEALYNKLTGEAPPAAKPAGPKEPTPKPLSAQAEKIDRLQKEIHAFSKDVNVDKDFLALVDEKVTVKNTRYLGKRGALYAPHKNAVHLPNSHRDASPYHTASVVYHELSHSMHTNLKLLNGSVIKEEVKKDFQALARKYRKEVNEFDGRNAYSTRYKELQKLEKEKNINFSDEIQDAQEKLGVIMDVIGSLTNGRKGGGHTKKYYTTNNGSYAELFAHGASLNYVENDLFKKYLPKLHDDLISIVKKHYGLK